MWESVIAGGVSGLVVSVGKELVVRELGRRSKRGDESAKALRSVVMDEAMVLKNLYEERRSQIRPTKMRSIEPATAGGEPRSEPVVPRSTPWRKKKEQALITKIKTQETVLQTAISAASPKNAAHVHAERELFVQTGQTYIAAWDELSNELMVEAYDKFLAVLSTEISKS